MSLYVLPALFALVLKLYVLAVAHTAKTSHVFCGMVLVFAAHNLTEVVGYLQFSAGGMTEFLFRIYYAATFAMLFYMCLYSIEVSKLKALKKLTIPIVAGLGIGSVLVLMTDLIVSGIKPLGYTVTALQGDYYWVFSLATLLSLTFVIVVLISGYRSSENHRTKVHCLYNLIALTPIVLLGFSIIPIISLGYQVNAAGILPVCTSLFLLVTLQSESKHRFTDLRRFLPLSRERKTANEIQSLISKFSMDEISYKEMSNDFEKIVLLHKLEQADDSISKAARLLKMKRSTLYSMLHRHGIKREKQQ